MTITASTNVLESASPERLGIDPVALERLYAQIEGHIAAGRYPGAAIAMVAVCVALPAARMYWPG